MVGERFIRCECWRGEERLVWPIGWKEGNDESGTKSGSLKN